jgi:hypothetical protein
MKIRRFPERGARGRALAFVIGLALLLAMATGLALAQEPEPQIETEASGPTDLEAIAAGAIPIQGRLTDQNGAPLNGTFSVTFRLYESSSGGTALCSDNNNVTVQNGLFSSYVDGCYDFVTGQRLYLGVQVGSDPEMTPRQAIYAVPYALTTSGLTGGKRRKNPFSGPPAIGVRENGFLPTTPRPTVVCRGRDRPR